MALVMDYSISGKTPTLIEGRRKTWRRNFNGSALNPDYWTVTQPVAGVTHSLAGGALTVNMNTTANAETVIQSVEGFTLPFRVQFVHSMSQRIADNHVYLEVVNETGDTYQGWYFTGTTATNGQSVHMNGGNSQPVSPSTAFTIATTSTTPYVRELDCRIDATDYVDRAADSSAQGTSRAVRSRTTLDPQEKYYIRMRFKNGATPPASNTINTVESVLVQDINDIPVEVAAGRGNAGANRAVPVSVQVMPTTAIVPTAQSSTTYAALNVFRNAALTNTSSAIKGTQGKLFGAVIGNPGASAAYVNFYNVVTATVGTTTPTIQIWIPAGGSIVWDQDTYGVNFGTAMSCAATDTSAVLSAVAPASPLVVTAFHI